MMSHFQLPADAVQKIMNADMRWMLYGGETNIKHFPKRIGKGKATSSRAPRPPPSPLADEANLSKKKAVRRKRGQQSLSELDRLDLPKTEDGCAWVHPGCRVEMGGAPIHTIMRTKTTMQCWCAETLKDVEITSKNLKPPDIENQPMSKTEKECLLPAIENGPNKQADTRRKELQIPVQGRVRLPPITQSRF